MNITTDTVSMAVNNLTTIVMATMEESDQNSDNLAVVELVFRRTAALLQKKAEDLSVTAVTNVRIEIKIKKHYF